MSWIMLEYLCPSCGLRVESLQRRGDEAEIIAHCDTSAKRVISAPLGRMKLGEAVRGIGGERPPTALDTRPLADGMPLKEWKRQRREKAVKDRWAKVKAEVG